jgi:hypothetical protein
MLGPVRRIKPAQPEPPILMSFGTNAPFPKESLLRTGCPNSFAERHGTCTSLDNDEPTMVGRHAGPS